MNFELMANSFPLLLAGAAITVEITAMSVTFGLLIGCMIGIARLCSIKPLRYFANVYVDFIRGTPLLVPVPKKTNLISRLKNLYYIYFPLFL